MGFMCGRETINAIFIPRRILEKYKMAGRKLYMVFVELEKPFDCIPREVISWVLRRNGIIEREILAVTKMYKNIARSVSIDGKRLDESEVKVRVQQGSVFSPLFVLDSVG